MADDPRRLDDLVATIANLRRQLDSLQHTALNRLSTHTHAGGGGGVTDHGALTGLGDDDHTQYLNNTRHDTTARHGSSVVDHGSIGGLGDDDHTQYHNDTRGDARYHRLTEDVVVPTGKQVNVGGSASTALFSGKVASTADDVFSARVNGEAAQRWMVEGDGYNWWGDGTAALDTNLYRGAANQLKTDDALVVVGNISAANLNGPMCSLYQSAAQSVPNNTWTSITFTSENLDTHSGHSTSSNTSRFTCPSGWAGYYLVSGIVFLASGSVGVKLAAFAKNGTRLPGTPRLTTSATDGVGISIPARVVQLAVGDSLELQTLHTQGASVNTFAGAAPETSVMDVAYLRN